MCQFLLKVPLTAFRRREVFSNLWCLVRNQKKAALMFLLSRHSVRAIISLTREDPSICGLRAMGWLGCLWENIKEEGKACSFFSKCIFPVPKTSKDHVFSSNPDFWEDTFSSSLELQSLFPWHLIIDEINRWQMDHSLNYVVFRSVDSLCQQTDFCSVLSLRKMYIGLLGFEATTTLWL